jgi:hypothetical protein
MRSIRLAMGHADTAQYPAENDEENHNQREEAGIYAH